MSWNLMYTFLPFLFFFFCLFCFLFCFVFVCFCLFLFFCFCFCFCFACRFFIDDSFNATFTISSGLEIAHLKLEGFACNTSIHDKYYTCWLCPQGTYADGIQAGCRACPAGEQYVFGWLYIISDLLQQI